jgi:hypothetical protein
VFAEAERLRNASRVMVGAHYLNVRELQTTDRSTYESQILSTKSEKNVEKVIRTWCVNSAVVDGGS